MGLSFGYEFQCPYPDVNNKAKGTYVIKSSNSIYYILDSKTHSIEKQRNNLIENEYATIPFFRKEFLPNISYEDFIQFDIHGNAYVLYQTHNSTNGVNKPFVLKYNPLKDETTVFHIEGINPFVVNFTLSDDGDYVFVYYLDKTIDWRGYATVTAISTTHPENQEVLFSGDWTEIGYRSIKNLCFDSNTKNLYFNYNDRAYGIDTCYVNNQGFYIVKPQKGKYLKKNLEKITTVKSFEVSDLISMNTKDGVTNYTPALNLIKQARDSKFSADQVEFTLKNLKDMTFFGGLYKEDENGKPLTDEAAIEHLYAPENFGNFFTYMCYYCCSNDFEYQISEKMIPLEMMLLVKETGEKAYNPDYDYLHSLYCIEDGFLFSNNDGLWGIYASDWKYTTIYHITDNKGNFIKRQNRDLKEKRLTGLYEYNNTNIIIEKEYFLFFYG